VWFHDRPVPPPLLDVAMTAIIVMIPVGLVAYQPDLGTALLICGAGAAVLYLAGLRRRIIGVLAPLIAAVAPLLWINMHGYQQQRVMTFLTRALDPAGAGYHIIQSKIAIGSGGLFGKGWFN